MLILLDNGRILQMDKIPVFFLLFLDWLISFQFFWQTKKYFRVNELSEILVFVSCTKDDSDVHMGFLESRGTVNWNWLSSAVSQSKFDCGNVVLADS